MVRKYVRKVTSLHKTELLILFYITSLEEWKIITQTYVTKTFNIWRDFILKMNPKQRTG